MEKLKSILKCNKYPISYLLDVLRHFKIDRELVLMYLRGIYTNNTICTNRAGLVSHTWGNFQLI